MNKITLKIAILVVLLIFSVLHLQSQVIGYQCSFEDDFTELGRKTVKFSYTERNITMIMNVLIEIVVKTDFIIFDEPTNGLDIITAKTVTDFLIDLKNEGKTIILSTHIFSLVEKICDRVGIIFDGKMIIEDDVEKLTQEMSLEDKFFEIYSKKVGGNYE